MTFEQFISEIKRLHAGFGIYDLDKLSEKVAAWYEVVKSKKIDPEAFSKAITSAIATCSKVPTLADLLPGVSIQENKTFRPCSVCGGSGTLSAKKNGYSYAFRCHCCENWKGKYDGFPMWQPNSVYQIMS